MKLNIDFEKKNSVCKEPYTYKKVVLKLTENIVFVCNVTKIVNTLVEKILVVSPLVSSSLFTVFPRIITGGDYFYFRSKGAIIRGKAIILGRRLFQIFLTGGRAPYILFYLPSNKGKSEIREHYRGKNCKK